MEIIELIIISLLATFSGFLNVMSIYIYINRFRIIQEIITYSFDFIANTEENQKLVYGIGGMFASGIKGGIGLELPVKQRAGKFKWQDLALELASQFFSKTLQNPPSPSSAPPPSSPTDILSQKNRDKW